MSIEATLEKIAESLEQIAARLPQPETESPGKPEKPAAPDKATAASDPKKSDEPDKSGKGRKKGGRKPKPDESTSAPADATGSEPAGEPVEVTADNVRDALKGYLAGGGDPAVAKAILEKHGAPSITALAPEKYTAVLAELSA